MSKGWWRWRWPALVLMVLAGSLAACGEPGGASGGRLDVVAGFYPLQWVAQRVGGAHVQVTSLAGTGAEPHDLELSPRDVARLSNADLVVYLPGFQPAVDDAVDREVPDSNAYDAGDQAGLDLTYTPTEEGREQTDEAEPDPHFWLDPRRLKAVAQDLADRLGVLDEANARSYQANAEALAQELDALDREFEQGLATCESRALVTSHNAFGYLAQRYHLDQVAIAGLTPEEEPSPQDLAAVADFVRRNDVKTIYFETLVGPEVAETVAGETGAGTAALDPLEGLNDRSQGKDYRAVMRANLARLREGQRCR